MQIAAKFCPTRIRKQWSEAHDTRNVCACSVWPSSVSLIHFKDNTITQFPVQEGPDHMSTHEAGGRHCFYRCSRVEITVVRRWHSTLELGRNEERTERHGIAHCAHKVSRLCEILELLWSFAIVFLLHVTVFVRHQTFFVARIKTMLSLCVMVKISRFLLCHKKLDSFSKFIQIDKHDHAT